MALGAGLDKNIPKRHVDAFTQASPRNGCCLHPTGIVKCKPMANFPPAAKILFIATPLCPLIQFQPYRPGHCNTTRLQQCSNLVHQRKVTLFAGNCDPDRTIDKNHGAHGLSTPAFLLAISAMSPASISSFVAKSSVPKLAIRSFTRCIRLNSSKALTTASRFDFAPV